MQSNILVLTDDFTEFNFMDKTSKTYISKIPYSPGVYIIYIKPTRKIQRLKSSDEAGILYIGKTKSLHKRIRQFWNSANGKYEHSGGIKYFRYPYLQNTFPLGNLFVRVKETKEKEITKTELNLLKRYIEVFGELPPLNSTLNNDR